MKLIFIGGSDDLRSALENHHFEEKHSEFSRLIQCLEENEETHNKPIVTIGMSECPFFKKAVEMTKDRGLSNVVIGGSRDEVEQLKDKIEYFGTTPIVFVRPNMLQKSDDKISQEHR